MILIIGGAYQGKLEFAIEKFNIEKQNICECKKEDLDFNKKLINNFEEFILSEIKNNNDVFKYIKENIYKFQEKIIISKDISQGVVPIDPLMRKWREENGKILTYISRNSKDVYRVFCGIGTKIK